MTTTPPAPMPPSSDADADASATRKSGNNQRRRMAEVRRSGRTWALCVLYALEFGQDLGEQLEQLPELVTQLDEHAFGEALSFARELARGVHDHQARLDQTIQASSPRWKVRRMDIIDRNILRLASFELFHRPDVPPRVVINEAVELAKRYGATSTRSFVNGILQQISIDNAISLED